MKKILSIIIFSCQVHAQELQGPLETGWKGQKVCEKLSENAHENILLCTFPPGMGHEKHKHKANFGYAISGGMIEMTDKKGIRTMELKTGSYFNSTGTDWHIIKNKGNSTIKYLIIEAKK